MKYFFKVIYVIVIITFFTEVNYAQNKVEPFFKNGDRICFLGNSITHGGQYHEFVQLFYATRYPNIKLSFRNCGISGDVADGMLDRLKSDVLSHKPTHVFLMTGMNDVVRTLYFEGEASEDILMKRKQALNNYFIKTESLAKELVKNNVIPIFSTPSIYDQYSKIETKNNMGCNDALMECAKHIKELAQKYNAPVVDFNSTMKEIMERELKNDSLFTIVGKDRVHPGTMGHFIMAYELLSTIENPSNVSKIEIDLAAKKKVTTENCKIIKFSKKENEISFVYKENALPFPMNKEVVKAIAYVPFLDKLNKETLKINNLDVGAYDITIEEVHIGTYSARQLRDGINLADNHKTPQYKQAENVMKLCEEYRKIGYQLRAVPYIQYKYLLDYKGENNKTAIKSFLDKKLVRIEGESYYEYVKKSMAAYFETLPKIDSIENRLEQTKDSIYILNKPKMLRWKIVKRKE